MNKKDKQAKKSETLAETKLVILGKNTTSFWGIDKNGKQISTNLSYENTPRAGQRIVCHVETHRRGTLPLGC